MSAALSSIATHSANWGKTIAVQKLIKVNQVGVLNRNSTAQAQGVGVGCRQSLGFYSGPNSQATNHRLQRMNMIDIATKAVWRYSTRLHFSESSVVLTPRDVYVFDVS